MIKIGIELRTLIIVLTIALQVREAHSQSDFDDLDSNKDGGISWPEYSRRLPLEAQGRLYSDIFQTGDTNGDTLLSPNEFYSLQTRLEESVRARYESSRSKEDIAPTPTPDPLLVPQIGDGVPPYRR